MSKLPHPAIIELNGVAIYVPRKCAFNSVKRAVWRQMGHVEGTPSMDYLDWTDVGPRTTVAVIRKPLERLISCWRDKVCSNWMPSLAENGLREGMPWDEFVAVVCDTSDEAANKHFRPWHLELPPEPDYVIRVEQLERDWAAVEHDLGWPQLGIPHLNASHGEVPLTFEQRISIRNRYAGDVEAYARLTGERPDEWPGDEEE